MKESKSANINESADNKRVVVPPLVNPPASVARLVGRNLTITDLDHMPVASDFYDKTMSDAVEASIAENKEIIFTSVKMKVTRWPEPGGYSRKFRFLWHGRGLDGRVILLVIKDVFPTMYIRRPDGMETDRFIEAIKSEIASLKLSAIGQIDIHLRKRLVFYEKNARPFARLMFASIDDFAKVADHLRKRNWIVADTDYTRNRFYLQAVRANNIDPAGMNSFTHCGRYNPYPRNIVSDLDNGIFVVNIADIRPYTPLPGEMREAFVVPRLTNLNVDIETGSAERGKALLAHLNTTHSHVVSFTLRYNRKDLLRVSLTTDRRARPLDGYLQFICANEIEMFILFANIVRRLRPALVTDYNGDNFDWGFMVTKLIMAGGVEMFFSAMDFLLNDWSWVKTSGHERQSYIAKQYMHNGVIKVSAEEMRSPIYYPELLSFFKVDVFTRCKIKWPSSKYSSKSLNAFLAKVGEPAKFDMPVSRQFDIYEDKLALDKLDFNPAQEKSIFSSDSSPLIAEVRGELNSALMSVLPVSPIVTEVCEYASTWVIVRLAVEERHAQNITDVNTYCVFDTMASLDLFDKAGIFTDLQITAKHLKCTLNESGFLAKAGLCIDKAVTSAFERGYLDCEEPREATVASYPGAHVLHPPVRGVTTISPTIAELREADRAWAIVSIPEMMVMMDLIKATDTKLIFTPEYNVPDDVALSPEARQLFERFARDPKNTPTIDVDFNSMYPTMMAEHNSSMETMIKTPEEEAELVAEGTRIYSKTWMIGNRPVRTAFVQATGPREKRGIIAAEQYLFLLKRKAVIKERDALKDKLLEMKHEDNPYVYDITSATVARFDAEQLECKVCMNSYYGKMGDPTNKFYRLAFCSDVTLSGREFLKEVISVFEITHGSLAKVVSMYPEFAEIALYVWRVRYCDTDSVYGDVPSRLMNHLHQAYYSGQISKIDYANQMVALAIKLGNLMEKLVNACLRATGSEFMAVACEGAHFPAMFVRQKRNCTGFHAGKKVGFKPNGLPFDYHTTGMADKKAKSASKLFSDLSGQAREAIMNVTNARSAKEIIREIIMEAYRKAAAGEWPMDMFIQRGQYKPEKNNISIVKFRERLRAEGRIPPKEYEKFEYVFVRRDDREFDEYGNKSGLSGSDYMELYSYAKENGMTIFFTKYMNGDICSELAQYMCADAEFVVDPVDDSLEAMADAENKTQENGKKFVEAVCAEAAGEVTMREKKPVYVGIRKHVDLAMSRQVYARSGIANAIKTIDKMRAASGAYDMYLTEIKVKANELAKPIASKLVAPLAEASISDLHTMLAMHSGPNSPKAVLIGGIGDKRDQLLTTLHNHSRKIDAFLAWRDRTAKKMVYETRASLGLGQPIITASMIHDAAAALAKLHSNEGQISLVDVEVPEQGLFNTCASLVVEIAGIERQFVAYDMLIAEINKAINTFTGAGTPRTRREERDEIAEALKCIDMPDL